MIKNIAQLCFPITYRFPRVNYYQRSLSSNIESPDNVKFQIEKQKKKHDNPFASRAMDSEGHEAVSNVDVNLEEKERRLKVLQLEVDIACQEGRRVPGLDYFKDQHWQHVLALSTKSARLKYYNYLWQIEMKKQAKMRKKEERAVSAAQRIENVREERANNNHIIYGLGHVSMFLRIYDSTINNWMNNSDG